MSATRVHVLTLANSFRMNHEYHLPPSLRPTVVQRTVPHEHAIDGICFPSLRDRMILLRGQSLVAFFLAAPDLSFRTVRLGRGLPFLVGRGRTFCSCI